MKKEQYEQYTKINKEVEHLKDFLTWCGKRYKNKSVGKYPFKIATKTKKFDLIRKMYFSSETKNTYEISDELQNIIIETIEKYVDEKEQELQDI
ncbi:MAG: hypothetical protein IJ401_05205 [Oscillospiraceae bacterium]|nr:hypothetical protein [Oscillospiraceae bacterium]